MDGIGLEPHETPDVWAQATARHCRRACSEQSGVSLVVSRCPMHEVILAKKEHFCGHSPDPSIVDDHGFSPNKCLYKLEPERRHLPKCRCPIGAYSWLPGQGARLDTCDLRYVRRGHREVFGIVGKDSIEVVAIPSLDPFLRKVLAKFTTDHKTNAESQGRAAYGASPGAPCWATMPSPVRLGNDTSNTTHPTSVLNGP